MEGRPNLRPILDYGMSPADIERVRARVQPTFDQIAAAIVSEADLRHLGRWAGALPPRRRVPRV